MKTAEISSTSIFPGIIDLMKVLNIKNVRLLLCALVAFIILRIPSLYEPHWYADEGIYAAITYAMENGKQLYVDIWDNKPLLIYWLYGLGDSANRLIFIRLLNLFAGAVSIVGIHLILNHLKVNKIIHSAALMLLVILIGTPIIEGNIANAENFFIPFTILGYGAILQKRPLYALSGLLFGIGFLLKFHPIFDFAAVLLFILITRHRIRHLLLALLFFLLPSMMQYIYLYLDGNVLPAINTLFLNNYGYTQSFSSGIRSLPFKTVLLCFAVLGLAVSYIRENISTKKLLIALIVVFEAYGVLFGGRQYMHYMFQIIPGCVLVAALVMQRIRSSDGSSQFSYLFFSGVVVFAFLKMFFYGEGTAVIQNVPSYYTSYYRYISGQQPYFLYPTEESLNNMRNALAKYPTKNIFIYTNNPWIYDVLEIVPPAKIVAGYHRTFIAPNEFMDSLIAAKTEVIVVDINADPYDALNEYILSEYTYVEQVDNYDIWLRK